MLTYMVSGRRLNEHNVPAALKAEFQAEILDGWHTCGKQLSEDDCKEAACKWHDDVTIHYCSTNTFTELARIANACPDSDWSSVEESLDTTLDQVFTEAGVERSTHASSDTLTIYIKQCFAFFSASIAIVLVHEENSGF